MKVLIVGSGGREHALAWALNRSPIVEKVYCAPGNGGTANIAVNVPLRADGVDELAAFSRQSDVDLVVIGPEVPLVGGVADACARSGIRCFGPSRGAARLEGSKVFAKEFMRRHAIPTAAFEVFDDSGAAMDHVSSLAGPIVVKADGLAAGKGVVVAADAKEAGRAVERIMVERAFGDAGKRVVVEECLTGEEVSVHAVCGGGKAVLLPSSQDHKRAGTGGTGPNTGGMGAYAPVPSFGANESDEVMTRVIQPTLDGLRDEGIDYRGVLYAGLMRTPSGPNVLEFNVRFGDPETQVLLPLIKGDLAEAMYEVAGGGTPHAIAVWPGMSSATVVMASKGYPGNYETGFEIDGLDPAEGEDFAIFHAGTVADGERVATAGGRVLGVTAWGEDLQGAIGRAYDTVNRVHFENAWWRPDIGRRAL